MKRWGVLFISLSIIFLFSGISESAILNVCNSGCTYSSIQAAVNAAQSDDTVSVASGTYYENINITTVGGNPDINGYKKLTIEGESRDTTIIDGNQNGRVFFINPSNASLNLIVKNLTIQNGKKIYGDTQPTYNIGSGIYAVNKTPHKINLTLTNNIVKNNQALGYYADGAIAIEANQEDVIVTLTGNEISNNHADADAGAILFMALGTNRLLTVTMDNNNIHHNTADFSAGVMFSSDGNNSSINANITDNTISSNSILNYSGDHECLAFADFGGPAYGGGIAIKARGNNTANMILNGNTITNNKAVAGSGIYIGAEHYNGFNARVTLNSQNNTITGNGIPNACASSTNVTNGSGVTINVDSDLTQPSQFTFNNDTITGNGLYDLILETDDSSKAALTFSNSTVGTMRKYEGRNYDSALCSDGGNPLYYRPCILTDLGDLFPDCTDADGNSKLDVPTECSTIKDAVNAAKSGDTVRIAEGTYYENIKIATITGGNPDQEGYKHLTIEGGWNANFTGRVMETRLCNVTNKCEEAGTCTPSDYCQFVKRDATILDGSNGDNFDDGIANGWTSDSGTWQVENGEYSSSGDGLNITLKDSLQTTEGYIETDYTGYQDGYYNNGFIIFDYKSPTDFKYATAAHTGDMTNHHWEIGRYDEGGFHPDAAKYEGISTLKKYRLRVVIFQQWGSLCGNKGFSQPCQTVQLFVCDPEATVCKIDTDFTKKTETQFQQIGNKVGLATYWSHAHFDNFKSPRRIFDIRPSSPVDITIRDLTIQNGRNDINSYFSHGGGLYAGTEGSTAPLKLTLTNNVVTGNEVLGDGGGLAIDSWRSNVIATLIDNKIYSNSTSVPNWYEGGGILFSIGDDDEYNPPYQTFLNVAMSNNEIASNAGSPGGIYFYGAYGAYNDHDFVTANLSNNLIKDNTGNGLAVDNMMNHEFTFTLDGNIIKNSGTAGVKFAAGSIARDDNGEPIAISKGVNIITLNGNEIQNSGTAGINFPVNGEGENIVSMNGNKIQNNKNSGINVNVGDKGTAIIASEQNIIQNNAYATYDPIGECDSFSEYKYTEVRGGVRLYARAHNDDPITKPKLDADLVFTSINDSITMNCPPDPIDPAKCSVTNTTTQSDLVFLSGYPDILPRIKVVNSDIGTLERYTLSDPANGTSCKAEEEAPAMHYLGDNFDDGTDIGWIKNVLTPDEAQFWSVENDEYSMNPSTWEYPIISLKDGLVARDDMGILVRAKDIGDNPDKYQNFKVVFSYDEVHRKVYWAGAKIGSQKWVIQECNISPYSCSNLTTPVEDTLLINTLYDIEVVLKNNEVILKANGIEKMHAQFIIPEGTNWKIGVGGIFNHAHFDGFEAIYNYSGFHRDNFNDGIDDGWNNMGWWTFESRDTASCPGQDCVYSTNAGGETFISTINFATGSSMEIEAEINVKQWYNGYIIFDYTGTNFKYAGINPNLNYPNRRKWVIGQGEIAADGSATFLPPLTNKIEETIAHDHWYRMKVVISNNTAYLYADDMEDNPDAGFELKTSFNFVSIGTGTVGIGDQDSITYFDNFKVYQK